MPDKERLVKLLVEYGITDKYIDDLCDEIEECFAPELEKARDNEEKARLWDRVLSAYALDEQIGCSYSDTIKEIHSIVLEDALEKEPR